jgi:hypothetical protein
MKQEVTTIAPANAVETAGSSNAELCVFGSVSGFETSMRMARLLAASSFVPKAYQGNEGLANCVIALEMANRIGMSPLMVMQNLYNVNGNPSWSAKFLIAALNSCGRFSSLHYEFKGSEGADDWGCRAYATEKQSGETLCGAWITIAMAKAEGWHGKNGSKWKTMPQLMLQYRAAAFFQRTYAPEISMGMQTREELLDIVDAPYEDVTPPQNAAQRDAQVEERTCSKTLEITEVEQAGNGGKADAMQSSCACGKPIQTSCPF